MSEGIAASRGELTKRVIPQMTLSDASNPLTAPPPPRSQVSPAAIAAQRFAIDGYAIVTGGAGNLGLEAARALLEHGSPGISIFDVPSTLATSRPAIDALSADFPNARIILKAVNITEAQAVEIAVAETAQELGSVDILLCFAGVVGTVHATDISSEEWNRVLNVNTTGSWFCAQAVGRQMIKQGTGGSIVLVASISGHRVNFPQPQVSYNVSKGALLQLKSSLAAEWARYGIRVNSISPGYMNTILNEGDGLEDCRKIWNGRNPMGRMGEPSELAGVVVLLCSKAGSYINGADILVDGGISVF